MSIHTSCLLCVGVLLMGVVSATARSQSADALTLVQDGRPLATVVLPTDPLPGEKLAADEIIEHIRLITGATLPRRRADEPLEGMIPIHIGRAADSALDARLHEKGTDVAGFALWVTDKAVHMRGLSDEGTRNGGYELLEQLGVRWFMPGELGLVVPKAATIALPIQDRVEMPSFLVRRLAGWSERNFPEWCGRMRNSSFVISGGHGIRPFRTSGERRRWFQTNPEFFRLIDGKRAPGQLCLSNPQVVDHVVEATRTFFRENPNIDVIGMGPNDGSGYCECDGCVALDPGNKTAFTNRVSRTDRYFHLYNTVLERIADEFPNHQIATLLYSDQMDPPVRITPNRRIIGVIAPIHVCRHHGPNNPNCPESSYLTWLSEQWGARINGIVHSGYWFNLACPGFPYMMMHRIREEIPQIKQWGHLGMSRSTGINWATEGPSLYLVSRLMWNHEADADAILDDYFTRFFGPASEPMKRYTMLLDAAMRDANHHTGSSWDMPLIYPASLRAEARSLLNDAMQRSDGIYRRRVELSVKGMDYLEAFLDMLDQRNRHEYVAAHESLLRIDAIREHLLNDYDIHMLRDWTATNFLRHFFRRATEAGYERVTGDNRLLAGLSPTWQFMIEPQGYGERMQFHSSEFNGGNMQPIDTRQTWSNHGLRYYWGEAWYRQSVDVPPPPAGQRVMLWFSGVHNGAKVWVNGRLLGTSPGTVFDLDAHGGASAPFDFDATDAVRFDGPNIVTVRVIRDRIDELGTGGLMGPVMFYARPPQDTTTEAQP